MTLRTRIVLLILGLVATASSILLSGISNSPISLWASRKSTITARSPSAAGSSWIRVSALSSGPEAHNVLSGSPWNILRRTAPNQRTHDLNATSILMPSWQRLLDESSPQARELFETGLAYLRSGKYVEARLAFQTLVRTYSGDKAAPLAYWALALSYYRNGGDENLLLALDNFRNYLIFFPNDPNLQELAEAAQIDTAVIWRELMGSSLTEETKLGATSTSLQALTQFLDGYPDSPSSDLAKTQVAQIKQSLPAGSTSTIVIRMMRVFSNSTQGAPIEQYLISGQVNASVIAVKIVTQNQK